MAIKEGDILVSKKAHPCGGNTWLVLRTGADYKLRCTTCQHVILTESKSLHRNFKEAEKADNET